MSASSARAAAITVTRLLRIYEHGWRAVSGGRNSPTDVTSAVGVDRVPKAIAGGFTADYADTFTLTTDLTATPERWARTTMEVVAGQGGQRIWRRILGLRLADWPWMGTVAGWEVAERGEHMIRLRARSWSLTVNLVVSVDTRSVTFTTLLRYDRPLGRIVWTPTSAVHRQLVPGLLREAAARLADSASVGPASDLGLGG